MAERLVRVGIGVFVCKQGKFLMGRRLNSHGEGSWSIPGGHLEFGETFEKTAEREVYEETGLRIKNIRPGALTNDLFQADNKHYVTVWMLADWRSGVERVCEPNKYVDLRWCDFDTLPQPLFLPWQQLQASPDMAELRQALALTSR